MRPGTKLSALTLKSERATILRTLIAPGGHTRCVAPRVLLHVIRLGSRAAAIAALAEDPLIVSPGSEREGRTNSQDQSCGQNSPDFRSFRGARLSAG